MNEYLRDFLKNHPNVKIVNPERTLDLLSSGEWEWDIDQDSNPGQINYLLDNKTYYDSEIDKMKKV